jgi:transcription elongation GreA/GreB family factor
MSRAFVKELDGDQADTDIPERPQSEHPNYITVAGLQTLQGRIGKMRDQVELLKARKEELSAKSELKSLQAELSYLEKRQQRAIPIDITGMSGDEIRFGATVEMVDQDDQHHRFTIVGEDEADVSSGLISWVSPLGRELLQKRAGDTAVWRRPAGDLELEILSVGYGEQRE